MFSSFLFSFLLRSYILAQNSTWNSVIFSFLFNLSHFVRHLFMFSHFLSSLRCLERLFISLVFFREPTSWIYSLIISDVEHLFLCFLTICFLWRDVYFSSSAHFLIDLFVFVILSCTSSLYILAINPMLVLHLQIFSPILRVVFSFCLLSLF